MIVAVRAEDRWRGRVERRVGAEVADASGQWRPPGTETPRSPLPSAARRGGRGARDRRCRRPHGAGQEARPRRPRRRTVGRPAPRHRRRARSARRRALGAGGLADGARRPLHAADGTKPPARSARGATEPGDTRPSRGDPIHLRPPDAARGARTPRPFTPCASSRLPFPCLHPDRRPRPEAPRRPAGSTWRWTCSIRAARAAGQRAARAHRLRRRRRAQGGGEETAAACATGSTLVSWRRTRAPRPPGGPARSPPSSPGRRARRLRRRRMAPQDVWKRTNRSSARRCHGSRCAGLALPRHRQGEDAEHLPTARCTSSATPRSAHVRQMDRRVGPSAATGAQGHRAVPRAPPPPREPVRARVVEQRRAEVRPARRRPLIVLAREHRRREKAPWPPPDRRARAHIKGSPRRTSSSAAADGRQRERSRSPGSGPHGSWAWPEAAIGAGGRGPTSQTGPTSARSFGGPGASAPG